LQQPRETAESVFCKGILREKVARVEGKIYMGATRVTITVTNPANGKKVDALFLVDTEAIIA
jgi:hypothetical protein